MKDARKRWILKEADATAAADLSRELRLPPLLANILVQRGFADADAARRFLSSSLSADLPSPHLLAGMDDAVRRIARALRDGERVCVWGDYDVDGTTGAAVLVSFLREIGAAPLFYIPHRIDEGYGMSRQGIEHLRSRDVSLVITVDCGISNADEVAFARDLGMDVVIVDHHQLPERLPEAAAAVINPQRSDCAFPDKGLCAAGLAFYLVIGLRANLRDAGWFEPDAVPDIRRHLDIVTLGTIADMVPLRDTNRVLTRRGLVELGSSERPGIAALKEVVGVAPGTVDAGTVAFQLGPRINAAGRMDAAVKVVEMLTTDSRETADAIARELDTHNRERRETEAQVLDEALAQIEEKRLQDRWSIVVGSRGWHPGVLGIVASRIVERFHRPAIVIGFESEEGKGSGRSIRGFHMVQAMRRCAELLVRFGGHEYAGGLSIREESLAPFAERFEEVAREALDEEDLLPYLDVDAEVDFAQLSLGLVRQMRLLGPFGVGNPEPVFQTRGVEVCERRNFNRVSRFRLRHNEHTVTAVTFGPPEDLPTRVNDRVDIVYRLRENEWQGTYAMELRLLDVRAS
ncbi:MAG: single-stranded-DNA-specific exonuclease RecJ [Deltaproteobacteria bacterium]|nr:single-stranded-DNA-specific exonuclease RecJ [Deltaproteobacteria bacterium]